MKKRTKKKEEFNLKKEYKKCYEYIKDSRKFIYAVMIIFLILALIGFFFQDAINLFFKDFLGINLNQNILDYLHTIVLQIQGMSQLRLISFIFFNNLKSTFFSILLGIIFGIVPIVSTISNGYLLGFASSLSVSGEGIFSLWRLLPHGIFELPAVFISLGLGLRLGMSVFRKNKLKNLKNYLINSFKVFLLVVIPLLIIAGIIEGTLIILAE
jgi:stage II sporulation protein M